MELIESIFLGLAYVVGIGFLLSGLDDLFFDTWFLRYLWRSRKDPHITLQELKLQPEQWIAILVPAWQEGGIVNRMAEFASRVVMYEKYDLFIGVYPNDPETIRCVDAICRENPRIHKVVVPHPGPTSKADCLNWIYRATRLNEIPGTREYQVFAVHDAEDVMHPLVLKLYNYFVPRVYDMGQVPVFALELPAWRYWTGNTYIDDFAELHTKDLFVRQALGGVVPSAGVGTAFSRKALQKLSGGNGGDPFLLGNLTEDYEVAIRIKRAGCCAGFISYPVDRIVRANRRDGSLGPPKIVTELVAIRENFPTRFTAAVRQRSRWILGISFQTWEQAGWAGSLAMKYTLLRDRRAPVTHLLNMLGYLVLAFLIFQWLFRQSQWGAQLYLQPMFTADSWLWKIAIIDTWLLAYRAVQRVLSVAHIYNVKQAAFSIPRVVFGNLINFTATIRATRLYLAHKFWGKPIVWHKTEHVFPGDSELRAYTESIEDLLVSEGLVTREQIFEALRREKSTSAPLCLLRMGLLDENQFTRLWSKHSRLPGGVVNPNEVPLELLRDFPEERSLQCAALPCRSSEVGVRVAFREPPGEEMLAAVQRELKHPVQPILTRPSQLDFARDRTYPRLWLPPVPPAWELHHAQRMCGLGEDALLEILRLQHQTRRCLPEVLRDYGIVSPDQARRLWAEMLGLESQSLPSLTLDRETHARAPAVWWWVHRLLPLQGGWVGAFAPLHPGTRERLAARLKAVPRMIPVFASQAQSTLQQAGLTIDPDDTTVQELVASGWLTREDAERARSARKVIADPLDRWLLVNHKVTAAQLYQVLLATGNFPVSTGVDPAEARRLKGVLPPGYSDQYGCHCIREQDAALTFGLTRLPSAEALEILYNRLQGYPCYFQTLSAGDIAALRLPAFSS